MVNRDRVGFVCDHELQVLRSHFEAAQRASVDVTDAQKQSAFARFGGGEGARSNRALEPTNRSEKRRG
jgi:hypothetical protein